MQEPDTLSIPLPYNGIKSFPNSRTHMNNDPRGAIVRQGNIMRIDNAFVEESSCMNDFNGYLVVSYSVRGANQATSIQTIRLNVSRNTVILNSSGQRTSLCRIRKGSWVNVAFSSLMTRSIPPQSNALLIMVQRPSQNLAPTVTTGRVASVDPANNFLYTGNPNNINSQTRFAITNSTAITNSSGRQVGIRALRPGQMVRITHANFQTASIPPQTTAFHIQILSDI